MTAKEARKILDELKYNPKHGTRRLDPQARAQAKEALRALGLAGETYTIPAPKKSKKKSQPSEVTNGG